MLGASWLVIPGWLFDWFNVRGKTEVTQITPTIWGLSYELSKTNWAMIGLISLALLTAVLGWLLLTKKMDTTSVVGIALAASIFTTPYAWEYEHLLLLVPLILLFLRLRPRWLGMAVWIGLVLYLPWQLYSVSLSRNQATFSAIVPLLVLILMITAVYSVRYQTIEKAELGEKKKK